MAAVTYRAPLNGDALSPPQTPPNDALQTPAHTRRDQDTTNPVEMDHEGNSEYDTRIPEALHTRSRTNRGNPPGAQTRHISRSFSARTKDLHRQENPSWIDKPLPPEPPVSTNRPDGWRGNGADPHILKQENIRQVSPPSKSQPPLLSRSNTVRSTAEHRRDWASDRSPLQKLEVTLSGISKEEKRARVLEAETRLKERMARQKSGGDNRQREMVQKAPQSKIASNSHEPGIEMSQRAAPEQQNAPQQPIAQNVKRPDHRRFASEGIGGIDPLGQGPPTRTKPTRSRGPPPQYSQHSDGKLTSIPVMRTGSAPRRAVSVSHRAGDNRMDPPLVDQPIHRDDEVPSNAPVTRAFSSRESSEMANPEQASAPMLAQQPYPNSVATQSKPATQSIRKNDLSAMSSLATENTTTAEPPSAVPASDQVTDKPISIALPDVDNETKLQPRSKKQTVSFNVPPPTPPPLSEWRTAPIARLGASDFDFQHFDMDRSKAWWEGGGSDRRRSRALPNSYQKPPAQKLAPKANRFQPPIFLKCGPLLRYAGLKRVRIDGPSGPFDKETWRGSILIVTKDSRSTYEPPPTLRVFAQPMDLLPPPPPVVSGENAQLPPEYVDPTAGLMKLGRDGRALYVKPVEHTEEEVDLSFVENDDGIYEMSPSLVDYSSEGVKQPTSANRLHQWDGETAGAYKEIAGSRLYADPGRDVTFWKFNLEVELGQTQQRVAYRLNQGPALGFWVPARGQSMNIMFHTCNGFSPGVDSDKFCGPDPLWRDVLNEHQTRPFHAMIGGGDQIFNDKVTAESAHFQEWVKIKNVHEKYDVPFSPEFRAELESSFLEHYSEWFSQGLYSLASSQIPSTNMWNDHEIVEGFGSYPDEFMGTPVISGVGNIAFKYYLLFQHHSVPEETEAEEPSWLLGAQPGPYINQRSRNLFMSLGDGMALLGLDCRTERMSDEILSEQTCDLIWDRCHREIIRGETKHLLVLLSIPLAYPRVAMVKNILNSRKSLGKAGVFGGFVSKNGGKVEIFDDHWTAKHHKSERTYLIEDLQDLAADKSVRVTILSGDVHLAAIGEFYSNPKLNIPKDRDYRYMPNIISSSIADMPETEIISDTLNKHNRVHHLDTNTDEDMIPIFTHDVSNKPRNNKRLLPRRNWCSIRQYQPGSTPPGTPEPQSPLPVEEPRLGRLQRTLSLTRGDRPQGGGGGGGLLRRLSQRGKPPTKEFNLGGNYTGRRMSMDGPFPPAETGDSYFPQPAEFRPGPFLRRPTNLSQKGAKKKQYEDGAGGFVNLEGGLSITLNLELNPRDPSGISTPYKILIPALRYDGTEYDPPATPVPKGWRKWLGVRRKKADGPSGGDTEAEMGMSEEEFDDEADYDGQQDYARAPRRDHIHESASMRPETMVRDEETGGRVIPKRNKWFGLG